MLANTYTYICVYTYTDTFGYIRVYAMYCIYVFEFNLSHLVLTTFGQFKAQFY